MRVNDTLLTNSLVQILENMWQRYVLRPKIDYTWSNKSYFALVLYPFNVGQEPIEQFVSVTGTSDYVPFNIQFYKTYQEAEQVLFKINPISRFAELWSDGKAVARNS